MTGISFSARKVSHPAFTEKAIVTEIRVDDQSRAVPVDREHFLCITFRPAFTPLRRGRRERMPEPTPGKPAARRVRAWLAWWAAMMALWVIVDDSLQPDELLAGAGAAALAAELATYQGFGRGRGGGVRVRHRRRHHGVRPARPRCSDNSNIRGRDRRRPRGPVLAPPAPAPPRNRTRCPGSRLPRPFPERRCQRLRHLDYRGPDLPGWRSRGAHPVTRGTDPGSAGV